MEPVQTVITIVPDQPLAPADRLGAAGAAADQAAAANTFADYRQRKAANTRRAHYQDLARFAAFLADAGVRVDAGALAMDPAAWAGVTWGLVRAFALWHLQQGSSVGSLNRALSTIKVYAGLATQARALSPEVGRLIATVRGYSQQEARRIDPTRPAARRTADGKPVKKNATTVLTRAQVATLKAQPTTTPLDRRDALLLALLGDHSLRCGELAGLQRADLDVTAGVLRFYREKVHKEQTHRLSATALRAALAYLQDRGDTPGVLLWGATKAGQLTRTPLTARAINARVGDLGRRIGVEGLSPHDLRHAWATAAVRGGTDVAALQDAGGWSSPAMPLRSVEASRIANERVWLDETYTLDDAAA